MIFYKTVHFKNVAKSEERSKRNDEIYFCNRGVVSSLGKGIVAASLGRLLKNRGLNVTIQKFDPYINVDPGTMSPYQHGEVFVTDDGAETDLDLGHYERFIDINLNKFSNVTTGKIYSTVLKRTTRRLPWRNCTGYPAHHKRTERPCLPGGERNKRGCRHYRNWRYCRRHRITAIP